VSIASTRKSGLVALLSLALTTCGDADAERAANPLPDVASAPEPRVELVEVQRVELGVLPVAIEASGSIQARRVSHIGAEVGGRLLEVFVDVGDEVESGMALFQIDPHPYEMALADARAGLELARAERDNAVAERERVERLIQERAVSKRRRDEQKTAAAVATARVAQMEARVERARNDLVRTLVRAPYAGSIVERLAHHGELAGADPVVVLQETGALVLELDIPESTPAPVREGAPVRIFVQGRSEPLETRVDRVSDRVDAATRTYRVRAPIVDPEGSVKAGSYARAEVLATRPDPRPLVDRRALLMRDGRSYLFRVEDGVARRIPVRVGAVVDERAEILSGVAEGDRVVRGAAVTRLADGDEIRVEDAASGDVASAAGPS
jgi:RND family efflux transporter MFP subunit